MKAKYTVPKENLDRYELEIFQSGCCSSLSSVSFADCGDHYLIEPDVSGLRDSEAAMEECSGVLLASYRNLVVFLRNTAAAVYDAEKYLVKSEHLSLDPDDIFFGPEGCVLLPAEKPSDFEVSLRKLIAELGEKYPQSRADHLLSILPEHFTPSSVLRFLTAAEYDLY